ncbi:peptidoglycan DD-metalloendopeptidase family protein [Nitratiruptor tergarcus]|uniref:Murein DD-endopeptidase MepM and murein hydrolase activator NlpD, contain LysM domain n=1 Tax=Nitratiruptor tergarcus DSM 16512 TaxID=1069081 RepID=A0A1W1WRY5_9BACT|nr:peptidoglycan DD-metalloendopeptidase family protein [Nitratiruptor tergarcus]SMC09006.1 Murein DD-endopeptidase MepM and murein hydrolase activator NlpD, contain LysM domain [Nitratiruptor tergarcus DSM 16512]
MRILLALLIALILQADTVQEAIWQKGETLLSFFAKHGIDASLYYNLDREDKELADEIHAGVKYFVVNEDNNSSAIKHLLIPINEELQIHIYKDDTSYKLEFLPIFYQNFRDRFSLAIQSNPYSEILKATKNLRLAHEFVAAFKNSLDFSHSIRKNDALAIIYEQKVRLGELFGMPVIKAALVETRGKKNYVFNYNGRYYDQNGKELESFLLKRPVRHARITSRFTLRRWHPILHRYRAHLGVDFGARRGTPVMAAGSGRVVFAGRKGGYGNVIIIAHRDGYKTLYAHLSKFRRNIRAGKYVKQGQIIGYVGSTGLSTGPHLHFGLYKNGRAINPLKVVRITKSRLSGKELRKFKKIVNRYKEELNELVQKREKPKILEVLKSIEGGDNAKG